jgi:hypothetical protein
VLAARHRFPSRGSMAVRTTVAATDASMVTPPPPEPSKGMFEGNPLPIQNLVGVAVRELFGSMMNAATAVRLASNSDQPRYFGTEIDPPVNQWLSPAEITGEDQVRSAVVNGGNAPQMANKTAAQGEAPRIAASLPQRRR